MTNLSQEQDPSMCSSNKISLKDGKELIGITNIVISELDNKIYINNTNTTDESIEGSIAFYKNDGVRLSGTGSECYWNSDTKTLHISNLVTDEFKSTNITSSKINAPHATITAAEISKVIVDNWIGFTSKVPQSHPFKIKVLVNPKTKKEVLAFCTNDIKNVSKPEHLLVLEDLRIYLNGITNMKYKTITESIGTTGDLSGDLAVDQDYIYFCTKDFDGISSIWKRCQLFSW